MKVDRLNIAVELGKPNPDPPRDALQSLPGAGHVELTLFTDEGAQGRSRIGFGRIAGAPYSLAALIEHELKPLVIGTDPADVRGTYQAMLRETEYHGSFGLAMFAIAAVDTALWDCLGKIQGVPCWQIWGRVHERIPAYAGVGTLDYDDARVKRLCEQVVGQGFTAVKVKVGYPTLSEDVRRVNVVRKAVGDNVRVFVDANQSLTTAEAMLRGRVFQELGCGWWEEPIAADDIDGYARLADALDIPVATGENLYTPRDFARFLKRDAVDIVQIDVRRTGGPTALLQIGQLADAFRVPCASHGGGPVQLSVLACLPNALYLEAGVIGPGSHLRLVEGSAMLPAGPGFDWE